MPNYRTSVLKDFSIVRKAFFQVYKDDGYPKKITPSLVHRKFKFIKQFPVQINPNELSLDTGSRKRTNYDPIPDPDDAPIPFNIYQDDTRRERDNDVHLSLDYNIYDEYNARTMSGGIPGNEISLHSDGHGITSLEELRQYADNPNGFYVMFVWGEIHIFGRLKDLKITYNVFSRWGEPLAASVECDIKRQPLGYNDKGIELDPFSMPCYTLLGNGRAQAEGYRKKRDIAMRAQLLATNALR